MAISIDPPIGESVKIVYRCSGCRGVLAKDLPDLKKIRGALGEIRADKLCGDCTAKRADTMKVIKEK